MRLLMIHVFLHNHPDRVVDLLFFYDNVHAFLFIVFISLGHFVTHILPRGGCSGTAHLKYAHALT